MWLEALCGTSSALVVYHHLAYPYLLKKIAARVKPLARAPHAPLPSLTLIVPAYNEAKHIEAKIENLAALEYPDELLRVIIVCDGCTDETAALARKAIDRFDDGSGRFTLVVNDLNRGKIAVLNRTISGVASDVIALSDASTHLPGDALLVGARHFADPGVGFVTGRYELTEGGDGAKTYWRYQTEIKAAEASLDSPIGAHGAFYMFRREPWRPLEADTINDDVIMPMRIVEAGFRGVYDPSIRIVEAEVDTEQADLSRRLRLGAGAIQQTFRLWKLADPRRPGLAFAFLSGKALRSVMPYVMIIAFFSNMALIGKSSFWNVLFALQCAGYLLGLFGIFQERARANAIIGQLAYLVSGHVNGFVGATRYLAGIDANPWVTTDEDLSLEEPGFQNRAVALGKRLLDIVIALIALVALIILFVPIALAIKLESKGPILYRQLRVGLRTQNESRLFYLTKFRTMRTDAEAKSGAVWATEHDPRVTRVGRFLRKSRLDELPQCIDVLRGEMSVVGPRPERPQFFNRLESEIPFYSERTYGLKPGITGLAQITLPYDSSIEDVRAKVLHDHAYAMQLSTLSRWLFADLSIIMKTFTVMLFGKGAR